MLIFNVLFVEDTYSLGGPKMNEKMKFNLIGVGIAFTIVGLLTTWAFTSFTRIDAQATPTPTISTTESPPPRLTATLPPTPTPVTETVISGYKFNSGNINGEKVVYHGIETSIAMLPQDVKVQVLKSAISTHEEAVAIISGIHDKWNETTGWGNIERFDSSDASYTATLWEDTLNKLATAPELYSQMAAVIVGEDVKKDLNNVAKLMEIANKKKDPFALVLAHRIIHDLDYWVYNKPPSSSKDFDKFGAANAFKNAPKSTVGIVEAFISENQ
jgi:hypothetical protein